jgi:hypothetical protein
MAIDSAQKLANDVEMIKEQGQPNVFNVEAFGDYWDVHKPIKHDRRAVEGF